MLSQTACVILLKLFSEITANIGGTNLSSALEMKRGKSMQESIQPKYYQAKVTCNCGNEFITGSTKPEIHVEICSKCHPFYTGQQKAIAARGRIERFNRKYGVGSNN